MKLPLPAFLDQVDFAMAGSGMAIWFASPPAGPSVSAVKRRGIVLRYEWNREPVQNFEAGRVHRGGMIASSRRSAELLEQLEAEAVRKLKRQGTAPKF